MMSATVIPSFIAAPRGPVFALHFLPPGDRPCRRTVMVVASFAEEMNRCRSMVTMLARRLAPRGIGTLVLDPYGTGDSGGEFTDHTWEGWRADLQAGLAWLQARGAVCDTLLGVRVGAMMASEAAASLGTIRHLAFWQPVLSGKTFFNQLLRIRVASDINDPQGIRKTDDLRRMLSAGDVVEIAGYEITPELARGLESAAMPAVEALSAFGIGWFEVIAQASQPVGRANQQYLEALAAAGARCHAETVLGEPFWQVHERAVALDLLTATEKWMDSLA